MTDRGLAPVLQQFGIDWVEIQRSTAGVPNAASRWSIADLETLRIFVSTVQLGSGDTISFGGGINVIVGPNNSGKTHLLSSIATYQGNTPQASTGFKDIDVKVEGSVEDAIQWCENNFLTLPPDYNSPQNGRLFAPSIPNTEFSELWLRKMLSGKGYVRTSISRFTRHLSVDTRLHPVRTTDSFSPVYARPQNALQSLWLNRDAEIQLSALVQSALGFPITVHREGGSRITLHVGQPSVEVHQNQSLYHKELNGLNLVEDSGHGVRALVSMLMEVMATGYQILVIDEPEAFLHPPQARFFAQVLSSLRRDGTQVIVATHSSDVLQGLIEGSNTDSLSITRLTRDSETHACQVEPTVLSDMLSSPLLRHSSILNGLFFRGVVLCESDGDATFYGAVNGVIETQESSNWLDLLVTHCNGGWARFAPAIRSLRAAGVPVASVVDMDVLNTASGSQALENLLEAHGTSIAALGIGPALNICNNVVRQSRPSKKRAAILPDLEQVKIRTELELVNEDYRQLSEMARRPSPWEDVKNSGIGFFSGPGHHATSNLVASLAEVGVFVVPVGELESFNKSVSRTDKAKWIVETMESRFFEQAGDHRDFVSQIRDYLAP